MKAPLKKSIQNKFADIKIDNDKLDALMNKQNEIISASSEKVTSVSQPLIAHRLLAISAMLLMAISLFIVNPFKHTDMAVLIANEVTHNHFKLKPLEVESNVLEEVNAYFTKLDFQPIPSSLLRDKKLMLLGARYCSLQGITAAQIRYQSQAGDITTFYEVPYNKDLYSELPDIEKGEEPIVSYSKGVGVKIWVEKGLLMAMTF